MKEIVINNEQARTFALSLIRDLPLSPAMQIKISEYRKKRTNEQNRMMWGMLLDDFSNQAIVDGRKFSQKAWNHFLKEQFLPNKAEEGITKSNYVKWQESPSGNLILIGSTRDLTTKGMFIYMEKCFSFGASDFGIVFSDYSYGDL